MWDTPRGRRTEAGQRSRGGPPAEPEQRTQRTTAYLLPSIPQNSGPVRTVGRAPPPPPAHPPAETYGFALSDRGFASSSSEQGGARRPSAQRGGGGGPSYEQQWRVEGGASRADLAVHEEAEAARRRARAAEIEARVRSAAQVEAIARQETLETQRILLRQAQRRVRQPQPLRGRRPAPRSRGSLPRSHFRVTAAHYDDTSSDSYDETTDEDEFLIYDDNSEDNDESVVERLGVMAGSMKARAVAGARSGAVAAAKAGRMAGAAAIVAGGAVAVAAVAATSVTSAVGNIAGDAVVSAAYAAGKATAIAKRRASRRVASMQAELAARTRLLRQMYPAYFDVEGDATRLNQFQSALACGAQAIEIPQGKTVQIPFNVSAGSEATWEWVVLELDIGFRASLRTMADGGAVELGIVPLARHSAASSLETGDGGGASAHTPGNSAAGRSSRGGGGGDALGLNSGVVRGSWCAGIEGKSGQLVLVWDNSYSWFTSKHVAFRVDVFSPNEPRVARPRFSRSSSSSNGAEGGEEEAGATVEAAGAAKAAAAAAAAEDDAAEAEAVAEAQQEERGAAGEKDEIRVQILHHALESGASAMMISTIIAADPRCVRARDAQRRLPLHVALTRPVAERAIIDAICAAYPRALRKRVLQPRPKPTPTSSGSGLLEGVADDAFTPCASAGMLPYEVALQNRVNQDVLRSLLRQAQELEKADSERKERRYQRRKLVESEEAERVAEEAKAARVTATEETAAEEAAAEEAAAEEAAGAGGAELDGAEAAADDAATPLRSRGGWSARVAYRSPAGRRMSGVLHAAATTGQLSLFRGDGNDAEHAYPVMSTQGCTINAGMLTLPTVDGSVDLAFLDAATLGEWEKRINAAKVAVPPSAAAAAAAALARSHALAYTSGAEEGSAGEEDELEALFAEADALVDYSTDAGEQ